MHKLPENRLNRDYAQEIIRAFRWIEEQLGRDTEGAVITSSTAGDGKFWCTGLELDESDTNPYANTDGFYPVCFILCLMGRGLLWGSEGVMANLLMDSYSTRSWTSHSLP